MPRAGPATLFQWHAGGERADLLLNFGETARAFAWAARDKFEPSIHFLVHPMRAIRSACFVMTLPLLLAACSSSAPRYVRQEVSDADAKTAVSECEYQIRLNKTPKGEQDELRELCMQGKGYRAGK